VFSLCTKSCHGAVNGLHTVENTDSYNPRFSIDVIFKKRRTGSFFDSFLSFSGWCGVRGSSEVTVWLRNWMEGERGSIAKRWSRRTEKKR
jgi:hypothetical protein